MTHPGIAEKGADAIFPKTDADSHKPDELLRWWHKT
jgi:hypothetical protein